MSKRSKDSQEAFNRIAAAPSKYMDTKEICYGRRIKCPYVQDHFIKQGLRVENCRLWTGIKAPTRGSGGQNTVICMKLSTRASSSFL